jgi:hypothetical protein
MQVTTFNVSGDTLAKLRNYAAAETIKTGRRVTVGALIRAAIANQYFASDRPTESTK